MRLPGHFTIHHLFHPISFARIRDSFIDHVRPTYDCLRCAAQCSARRRYIYCCYCYLIHMLPTIVFTCTYKPLRLISRVSETLEYYPDSLFPSCAPFLSTARAPSHFACLAAVTLCCALLHLLYHEHWAAFAMKPMTWERLRPSGGPLGYRGGMRGMCGSYEGIT